LLALPDDAFAEKYELKMRPNELREQATQFAVDQDEARSDADLLSELSGLRSELSRIEEQKIDLVVQAGGGACTTGNMGNLGGVGINAGMMEATGANRVKGRIGVVKGILKNRGVEIPNPN